MYLHISSYVRGQNDAESTLCWLGPHRAWVQLAWRAFGESRRPCRALHEWSKGAQVTRVVKSRSKLSYASPMPLGLFVKDSTSFLGFHGVPVQEMHQEMQGNAQQKQINKNQEIKQHKTIKYAAHCSFFVTRTYWLSPVLNLDAIHHLVVFSQRDSIRLLCVAWNLVLCHTYISCPTHGSFWWLEQRDCCDWAFFPRSRRLDSVNSIF